MPLAYILPVRLDATNAPAPLGAYLARLAGEVGLLVVVDGSDPAVRSRNIATWPHEAVVVEPEGEAANPKVAAVLTGLRVARAAGFERCVVADDDVRYDAAGLAAIATALATADVVVPQNYFRPAPWHALEDTARTLFNRAFGVDYPGTLGVRASSLRGGYCGDVLFENLELMRTVRAAGGRVCHRPDVFVRRVPPTTRHFLGQRVRQAYDSQAQPLRLLLELALLPTAATAVRRPRRFVVALVIAMCAAEFGRRRRGGRQYFSPLATAWAPMWLAERAVCSWVAVGSRLRGGARYRGRRLRTAAHSTAELRRRAAKTRAGRAGLVGPVAERLDARPPAPAQRHGLSLAAGDCAVGVADLEVAAEQERTVRVAGDHGGGFGRRTRIRESGHLASFPNRGQEEPPAAG